MLIDRALAWIAQDPDAETRAELQRLVDERNLPQLESRMDSRIGFGTAGLRGELGAGPNRMNRVLVAQAAAGIAEYLNANFESPSAVIGYDARSNSRIFAEDSAQILAAAGIRVSLAAQFLPTPVLAFAVKQRGYSAGIMVTASHNPPRDNGYKVYLGGSNGGGQIISPIDSEISALIEKVAATKTFDQLSKSDSYSLVGEELIDEYVSVATQATGKHSGRQNKIVYSAIHGVGWQTAQKLFAASGIDAPIVVQSQIEPDGDFPTVAFPNPEEPGAMDESYRVAEENDADLILVNDPDADRLAVAIRIDGKFQRLTGDQIGLLLADDIARRSKSGTLACSIVSCSELAEIAKHNNLQFVETLTGFKYLSKVPNLVFAFEEALGYCIDPSHVPDKDGISAAARIAILAGEKSIAERLQEIGERYGHFATKQLSIRFDSIEQVKPILDSIAQQPPARLASQDADFTATKDYLRFDLLAAGRVIIRASGTEPKLKAYLQTKADSAAKASELLSVLAEAVGDLIK